MVAYWSFLAQFWRSAGSRALHALEVFALRAAAGAAAEPPRTNRPVAAERFEQPAEAGAALGALEQFDRVDAELEEQLVERLGARGGGDLLLLVDPVQREVDVDLDLFAARPSVDLSSATSWRMMLSSPT